MFEIRQKRKMEKIIKHIRKFVGRRKKPEKIK